MSQAYATALCLVDVAVGAVVAVGVVVAVAVGVVVVADVDAVGSCKQKHP